jgi:hypothetical protein
MVSTARSVDGPSAEGDPIRPGFFRSLSRRSGDDRRRRALLLVVGLAVVVVLVSVGLLMSLAASGHSQSYKDGYSVGGDVYSHDATVQADPQQACQTAELRRPSHGGPPSGANGTQWIKGCVAAFNEAQNGD